MKIRDFVSLYEEFCPKELAVEGDPVGLQIGSLDAEVKKVLVALDIREQTVLEAIENGVDLILAKHPVIFRPLTNLTDADSQEKIVLDLAKAGIAVYTSHTNIDVVDGGLNDWFCELLEIQDTEVLTEEGLGRVGNIEPMNLAAFSEKMKQAFNLDHIRLVTYDHSLEQMIRRVAICGGSGGKFWPDAKAKGADIYITGDIYYHAGHDQLSQGLIGLDPGHYLEHLFIPKVSEKLKGFTPEVEILESKVNTNPFYDI
ncbi:Nif3-like dinuclear metal center hexameric protein [Lactococcus garvieae]|uniref:Nif3-like dinuclear metal center hexameric protein n=1 Tax=Lactococcus garvieae TaxID=1363 RepID=UPI0018D95742|nr:Nif3-like dinuclear metal center hexameric protein [Lactococcus garvieae]QPS71815.1 Nif3-like dinuclear metal center hexameric protein [Lactococcus garvieae]